MTATTFHFTHLIPFQPPKPINLCFQHIRMLMGEIWKHKLAQNHQISIYINLGFITYENEMKGGLPLYSPQTLNVI